MMTPEQQPWQWDEPTWRGHVDHVRAGRALLAEDPATRWPGGATAAVALSFDSDHETPHLRDGNTSPGLMAVGEYSARVGVPRILALLAEYDVPASFYLPAVCALLRPDEAPSYVEHGHEVAVHGWIHERNTQLGHDDELDLISRATDVLESQTGIRPTGFRSPSWDFSDSTLDVIKQVGFAYDSSLMADDEPYEILDRGERTGIVEIPVEWIRDDAPVLMMSRYEGLRPYMAPRTLAQIWIDEFDQAHADGGLFQLTMHPMFIGHRSRLVALRLLVDHIRTHTDVWWATHADVARHAAANL
ncbi:polysaccharide deacetylase [Tersicoccus sp. Bi-70]|uniref:polysaccharide deacetylase family protein n=1 Tax=Tersicoccus sp. Bi-70 TaxID=1897634 RepID=UPI0009FAB10C|nr:polysaccharide deacetylase [Tersicoccus sp. Bi-70]